MTEQDKKRAYAMGFAKARPVAGRLSDPMQWAYGRVCEFSESHPALPWDAFAWALLKGLGVRDIRHALTRFATTPKGTHEYEFESW